MEGNRDWESRTQDKLQNSIGIYKSRWRDKGHLRDWAYITVGVMALSVVLHFMALIISPLKTEEYVILWGRLWGLYPSNSPNIQGLARQTYKEMANFRQIFE